MNTWAERHPNLFQVAGALIGFLIGLAAFHTLHGAIFVMVGAFLGPTGWRRRLWRASRST